eukprot:458544_1
MKLFYSVLNLTPLMCWVFLLIVTFALINTINSTEASYKRLTKRKSNSNDLHKYSAMMSSDDMDSEGENSEGEYSDKEQSTALILAIVLGGVGGGRWYIGDYAQASLMLVLFITLNLCLILFIIFPAPGENYQYCLFCFSFLIWVGLVFADIIRFAMNDIPDVDELTLHPM